MTSTPTAHSNERGIALITTLLILMLMSALLVGFTTLVTSDQRYRFIDHDRGQAFYAANGAIEKMTSDLGNLFLRNVAPSNAQVTALTASASQPTITNVTYVATSQPQALTSSELSVDHCYSTASPTVTRSTTTVGTWGYAITFCANSLNNPTTTPDPTTILSGAYAGLYALKTPYQLDATAKTSMGGEIHLIRSIEAVSIPVFQFGIYSDVDLAFNAAQDFSFGGRVHTNGNLFLAQGGGSTLTLSDKVTAVKEVIRQRLSNGNSIDTNGDTGTVNMAKGGGTYTSMLRTWGSVVDGVGSALNEPTWSTTSTGTYKGYIKNGRTGAKRLDLPLIAVGGTNTDVVRRPLAGEDMTQILYNERLFGKASIRVMLSDNPADIMAIPGLDITVQPTSLETGTFGTVPVALSPGPYAVNPAPLISGGPVAAGTAKVLSFSNYAALPPYYSAPGFVTNVANPQLTATSGANSWSIRNCTGKTGTTFTGCTTAILTGTTVTIPSGATITGGGFTTTATAAQTPTGVGTLRTITVSNTMGMAPNTFWIGDQVITCSGYTNTAPVGLNGCTLAASVATGDAITNFSVSPVNTSLIGGYIKIERQNATDNSWHDITAEMLGYGIGGPSLSGSCSATDPSPNAILRLQRLADDAWPVGTCLPTLRGNSAAPSLANIVATDYWPNSLFDTREGWSRDSAPASGKIKLAGVMYYIAIDAANLAKWFAHTAPYGNATDTGNLSKTDNTGYSIYISDRRNNRDSANRETAEFGYEDFVNPLSTTAAPNGLLDTGEDVNQNTTLETYGGTPNCNGSYNTLGPITVSGTTVTCANTFFTTTFRPQSDLALTTESFKGVGRAMVNRPIIFRRAIKLINGSTISTWVAGFTVVTENPVYVHGDWNATQAAGLTGVHAASAVIADAVTVLSNNWTDLSSYASPWASTGRTQRTANSYYRMAVIAGKGVIFPNIAGTIATYGTDGGAHNFLRFLENNAAATDAVHYKGSMATFYYNRQAVGIFKGNGGYVYGIPALRDYAFDVDFQTPSLLPPLTPMFRDINTVGFSQELRPGK